MKWCIQCLEVCPDPDRSLGSCAPQSPADTRKRRRVSTHTHTISTTTAQLNALKTSLKQKANKKSVRWFSEETYFFSYMATQKKKKKKALSFLKKLKLDIKKKTTKSYKSPGLIMVQDDSWREFQRAGKINK